MAVYIITAILIRIVLPALILPCVMVRPSLLSSLYLLMLFYLPFVPVPYVTIMPRHTVIFLLIMIVISALTSAFQATVQILLFFSDIFNNNIYMKILRYIGCVKWIETKLLWKLIWFGPEIGMLTISISFFLLMRHLHGKGSKDIVDDKDEVTEKMAIVKSYWRIFASIGKYCILPTLCAAAILKPSAIGLIYFLLFLFTGTWWAYNNTIGKGYAVLLLCFVPLISGHMGICYAYQLEYFQAAFPKNSLIVRLLGLTPFITLCSEGDYHTYSLASEESAYTFLNPFLLYILYSIIVLISKELLNPTPDESMEQEIASQSSIMGSEKSILSIVPSKRLVMIKDSDDLSSITSKIKRKKKQIKKQNDIKKTQFSSLVYIKNVIEETVGGTTSSSYESTLWGTVRIIFEGIMILIVRYAYIGTIIIMMCWSVTVVSWISLVFLIWAIILWMVPNTKHIVLQCSQFLAICAILLLINNYVYSLDVSEKELPTKLGNIMLTEMNYKETRIPQLYLFIRSLYTLMFWITMRQRMQDKIETRLSKESDIISKLSTISEIEPSEKGTSNVEEFIGHFLTRFWIWLLALFLFLAAVLGQRMSGFRIGYMSLFLFLILSFQFSFQLWRKIITPFLWCLVAYATLILLVIYTYQFEGFDDYWENYFSISKNAQYDIGLELFKYKTQYLQRIVTPTILIILTNIQVHYIHEDFMKICDPNLVKEIDDSICEFHMGFKITYIYYRDQVFHFLEIHMIKIVILFAMFMCTFDVCATYFVIVVLLSLSFIFGRYAQIFTILFSSLLISIYILAQMLYQMQIIHEPWVITCKISQGNDKANTTVNITRWLGFKKLAKADMILTILDWDIGFVIIVTLWVVVLTRQRIVRKQQGLEDDPQMIVFPGINAKNAHKSLLKFSKYVINYGFYRIGVEICLIWTAIVIAIRMDMYSILYSIWLCLLFPMKRRILRRIWIFYLLFLAVIVPFQFLMAIGLPPWLCLEYPWDEMGSNPNFRIWAFLPSKLDQLPGKKILPDFILLMLVSIQWSDFLTEYKNLKNIEEYEGGSNESILHFYEKPNFVNPINDFMIHTRSYLDIIKRAILPASSWLSLAVVFLTSIYQVNIFYIGYLLLSFIYLWHGGTIYLMPISKLLRRWQWLIGYTAVVILAKTSLQIIGCFFIDKIPRNYCWSIKVFAISCNKDYKSNNEDDGHDQCQLSQFVDLSWDIASFALLIIQRRIFCSYDFFHLMNNVKANIVLGSRGLEILDQTAKEKAEGLQTKVEKIKEKIDLKLTKIIANHMKIQGSYYNKITTHEIAIRSGDYYMFDELEKEDVEILPDIQDDKDNEKDATPGIGEMISLYLKTDMDTALQCRKTILGVQREESPQESPLSSPISRIDTVDFTNHPSMFIKIVTIIWIVIDSCMISAVNMLNEYSKDYRNVQHVLYKEKQALKEKTNYHIGVRLGPGQWWQPTGSYNNLMEKSQRSSPEEKEDVEEMSASDRPTIIKLLSAVSFAVLSESSNICYTVIFLNQLHRSSFLYLPLTLMVFFWATLTVPRPSKSFWVLAINYTAISVLLKGLFQFDILPDTPESMQHVFRSSLQEDNPFYPPEIIGLDQQDNYALWDLFVLLAIFMHRENLKMLGMWKETFIVAVLLEDGAYELHGGELVKSPERQKATTDLIHISAKKASILDHLKGAVQLSLVKYAEGCRIFFQKLLKPSLEEPVDVYMWIFWCEFINLFVVLFGYTSFVTTRMEEESDVASYITSNKIPVHFLIFQIILFVIMLIDRALYLSKNIMGKIIFQLAQVLVLHIWLIILFPMITGRQSYTSTPPQIFYLFKCFYFLLSAYQIRRGYPSRILGYFCCKNFGILNYVVFKIYMIIPFLFEIRTCLDWMLTETSMSIFEWIKMEDIFRNIFIVKCERAMEKQYSSPRGKPKRFWIKIIIGSLSILALSAIIWFPLILFSMSGTVGVPNIPKSADLKIRIGRHEPIFYMSDRKNIFAFKPHEFNEVKNLYNPYKISKDFIYKYDANDVAAVVFHTDSTHIWSITALNRQTLIEEVESIHPLPISLIYRMSYSGYGDTENSVEEIMTAYMAPHTDNRNNLLKMLKGQPAEPVHINYILPKFLAMSSSGNILPVPSLMLEYPVPAAKTYRNITLMVQKGENTEWWRVQEQCGDFNFENFLQNFPYADCNNFVTIYTFNERIFTSFLEKITGGGILALYGIYFIMLVTLVRNMFYDFNDNWIRMMPNADRIYKMCNELYLCREMGYFQMEEELFAKLIFLMRSGEMIVYVSRENGN